VRVTTLLLYLLGSRAAVLEVAQRRESLAVGFLFVVAAGLAREYDQECLWHEPWYLLLPLLVSSAASVTLLAAFSLFPKRQGSAPRRFLRSYCSFLGLFWMTAPLAFFYAIPYERLLSEGAAVWANLWTLLLVAVWRVALITRVLNVVLESPKNSVLWIVMLFCDTGLILIMTQMPFELVAVMSGVDAGLSQTDEALRVANGLVGWLAALGLPVCALGALGQVLRTRPDWSLLGHAPTRPMTGRGPLLALAIGSVATGVAVLPLTQPEQELRHQIEHDFREGRLEQAIARMLQHSREELPPLWDLPPRPALPLAREQVTWIAQRYTEPDIPMWVRRAYIPKFERAIRKDLGVFLTVDWLSIAATIEQFREANWLYMGRSAVVGGAMMLHRDLELLIALHDGLTPQELESIRRIQGILSERESSSQTAKP